MLRPARIATLMRCGRGDSDAGVVVPPIAAETGQSHHRAPLRENVHLFALALAKRSGRTLRLSTGRTAPRSTLIAPAILHPRPSILEPDRPHRIALPGLFRRGGGEGAGGGRESGERFRLTPLPPEFSALGPTRPLSTQSPMGGVCSAGSPLPLLAPVKSRATPLSEGARSAGSIGGTSQAPTYSRRGT
jgi:hypothetical protein